MLLISADSLQSLAMPKSLAFLGALVVTAGVFTLEPPLGGPGAVWGLSPSCLVPVDRHFLCCETPNAKGSFNPKLLHGPPCPI